MQANYDNSGRYQLSWPSHAMDESIVGRIQLLYQGLVLFLIEGFRFGGATSRLLLYWCSVAHRKP